MSVPYTSLPRVEVGGGVVDWIERSSITIDKALNARSTARMTLVDIPGTRTYARGEQLAIYDHEDNIVFSGIIDASTAHKVSPTDPMLLHRIQAIDWHYMLDKRRIAHGFKNRRPAEIIDWLAPYYLHPEGIVTVVDDGTGELVSTLSMGPLIEEFAVNYASMAEVMDQLAEISGAWWNVDENKVLWMRKRGTEVAPWTLTNLDIHGDSEPEVQHGNPEYRNSQIILGGVERTQPQRIIREGDGRRTAYVMPFALDSAPVVDSSIDNGVTWTQESVAESGTEEASDARWNWTKGDRNITTSFSPPATGVLMRFRFIGQYPIVVEQVDRDQVLQRANVEGGTGIIQSVASLDYGANRQSASTIADARLQRFAVVGRTVTVQTTRPGLRPGQMLTVDLPGRNIHNQEMLITRLGYRHEYEQVFYSVTAVEGPETSPWKALHNAVKSPTIVYDRVTVGESAASLVVRRLFERVWGPEELGIWTQVYPSPDLYPSTSLYPMVDPSEWVTYLAWENEGTEMGRRPLTRVHEMTEDRLYTTVFLGPDVANEPFTHLVWYAGDKGTILLERVEWQYEKNDLEALQIDRIDERSGEGAT